MTHAFLKCLSRLYSGSLALLAAFFLLPGTTGLLQAQVTTADIVGTVTDASGAVVPGAAVKITNLDTQATRTTTSGDGGQYTVNLLQTGKYEVQVELAPFKTTRTTQLALAAGDRVRVDVKLEVGGANETVEVTSSTPLLQSDNSSISTTVTENAVQDIPLNGRNVTGLIQVQPGVNTGPPNGVGSGNRPDDRRQSSTFSANGQSDIFNNQLIDGVDNNERVTGSIGVRPSIDAIAEVKVDTNNYTAEVGRAAGAVVNILTKSGTNRFHGTLYEFFRNDIFDARDYFARAGVVNKPRYRQNQFGGSVGGPIFRDKTFFFTDLEALRVVQGLTFTSNVPTQAQHDNPASLIPTGSTLDPVGLNYFRLYPSPNLPGATNNFVYTPNRTFYSTTGDARIDHHFNERNTLFARYSYNRADVAIPGALPNQTIAGISASPGSSASFSGPSRTTAHGGQLDYVRVINPNLVMDLKAGYVRVNIATLPINTGVNASSAFGVLNSNLPNFANTSGLMPITVSGLATLGDSNNLPIIDINNSFQELGTLSYSRGNHNAKFGASLIRRQVNRFVNVNGLGVVAFSGSKTGTALGDLLTGRPTNVSRSNQIQGLGYRAWEGSAFAQDAWRIAQSLTLNLGVRYDIYTPITEVHNGFSNFNPSTLSLNVGGTGGIKTQYTGFAPRVGFAYTARPNTILRGGFGISYYPVQVQSQMQNVNAPYFFTITNCAYPCNGLNWPNVPVPIPSSTTNLSGSVAYLPSNYNLTTVNQTNLNVQQAFGDAVFQIGYVGSFGRHLPYKTNIDLPDPTGPYPTAALPTAPRRLFATQLPAVSSVAATLATGTTNYHSLQTSLSQRLKRGLSYSANYTWAHGLGTAFNGSYSSSLTGVLARNSKYDYGNTDIDIRHRVAVTFNYELPGKSLTGLLGVVAKGWQVNSLTFWQSGSNFSIGNSRLSTNGLSQINLPNTTQDRPNVVQGAPLYATNRSNSQYFNLAAFTPQPAGTPGNARRNLLYGPNSRRSDLSLFKTFTIHESLKLQSRVECFNISNSPNFANPGSTITTWARNGVQLPNSVNIQPGDTPLTNGGFGTISSTNLGQNPRQFQFALKLLF